MGRAANHNCDGRLLARDADPKDYAGRKGKWVTAYVRLGNPSQWLPIGTVCTTCKSFQPTFLPVVATPLRERPAWP